MTISYKPTAVPRTRVTSGSEFERLYNYSRAVLVGSHLMISGTTGYDYASSTLAEGAGEQTEQLVSNVEAALAQVRHMTTHAASEIEHGGA